MEAIIENDESKFTFIHSNGTQKLDRFLVLKVLLDDIKPEVVVEVREFEDRLQSLDMKKCNNNVLELTRKMESTWREINKAKPGSYDEGRFIRELFRDINTSTNQDFKSALGSLKRDHTLRRNNVTYASIIEEANSVYKTMMADGEWAAMSASDKKIVALTTKLAEAEKSIKVLLSDKDTSIPTRGREAEAAMIRTSLVAVLVEVAVMRTPTGPRNVSGAVRSKVRP